MEVSERHPNFEELQLIEPNSDAGDSGPDYGSDSSGEGDRDLPSLPNLEQIRRFMTSGNALSNLRHRLRDFLEPQSNKNNGPPSVGQSDTLTNDNSIRDQSIAELIPVGSPAEPKLLDLQNGKEYSRVKPGASNMTLPETGTLTIGSHSATDVFSELSNDETEISLLSQAVIWLQEKALVFVSTIVSHFASAFVEPPPSPGLSQLKWTCVSTQSSLNPTFRALTQSPVEMRPCLLR